jgi:hypothetical protein
VGATAPAFSGLACLFTVPWGIAPLPPFTTQGAPPSFYMSFLLLLLIIQVFFFFPWWGLVCQGAYADLAQSCLWEYRMPLSSPCPRLPKPSGHGWLAAWGPSLFLCLTCSGDALCRLKVWRGQSFACSGWFFL